MCGRFVLKSTGERIADHFHLDHIPTITARYNIAPTQDLLAVCAPAEGMREPVLLRWGLIPHWSKGPDSRYHMINARAETAAAKPAYRQALNQRRCLVPADGYYEWHAGDGPKQPFYLHAEDGSLLAFAGLWEEWDTPQGESVRSCALMTREALGPVGAVYDRMPVLVPESLWNLWLAPDNRQGTETLDTLLAQPVLHLQFHPVSRAVNSPGNEGHSLIEPA